jgi:hypothetical protein
VKDQIDFDEYIERIAEMERELSLIRQANTVWYDQYCGALKRINVALSFLLQDNIEEAIETLKTVE